MKKIIGIGILFFIVIQANAQLVDGGVVVNVKLQKQLMLNQKMRLLSESFFRKNYRKQKELYDKINRDMTKVLAVHNFIYKNLSNVNEALKQGKKLKYLWSYVKEISENGKKLAKISVKKPQYAILRAEVLYKLLQESWDLSTEVSTVILRENKDFLIDPYDREILIEKMLDKARMINGYILYLIHTLETANRIAYLEQIPVLGDYVSLDRHIVEDIIKQWKNL